jgi:thiamine kinase-like enzyme
MSKQINNENKPESLLDQSAVRAWRTLGASGGEPKHTEILKDNGKKRAICRLAGVGLRGTAVIAKRCRKETGFIERTIYEEVLPHLPVTAPHFYGFAEEDDTFCWLFLEDVGTERFSPLIEEHRVLAARWLGLTHTVAARMATTARLPDRGPDHYLAHLRSARAAILQSVTNSALATEDLAVLKSVVAQCDALESDWKGLEKCCTGMPVTLVHGDFRRKNLYIQTKDQAGTGLFPIDWETAGCGIPAADLAPSRRRYSGHQVDLPTYLSIVRECWPSLDMPALKELVRAGSIFRRLAAIDWASRSLSSKWTDGPVSLLRGYHTELADFMQATSWAE